MRLHTSSHFSTLRNDFHASFLEFVGTFVFLLLGLGGIQAAQSLSDPDTSAAMTENLPPMASDTQRYLYISTSMGFSLLVSAWLFFRITGGLFNPNVSLSLMLVGAIRPVRCAMYCIAQLVGAIAAAAVVRGLTGGRLRVNTTLGPRTSPAQGVFIEMFITAALVVSVLMLAAEKHQATPFAPIGIGLTLFSGHLFAVYYTGAAMNTARSFGPAVVTGFPDSHHWVYWLGPFLGSLLGSAFYGLLKHYRYWVLVVDEATDDQPKLAEDPTATFVDKSPRLSEQQCSRPRGPLSLQPTTMGSNTDGSDDGKTPCTEKASVGSSSLLAPNVAPALSEHGRGAAEINEEAGFAKGKESNRCPV
ncbi:hypothetical protein CCMSSC00406_0008749 [Pleurotus cornucopiae]|uniref:Uncharacterized protein n=1 Tax=Pleurotus cornucopiae TaxID=5321 RepID=A0ACB7J3D7_PLECO|nr:hypothetical protein CCMSSC00406_0008749 [Pleurotus cornucopiae]